MSCLNEVRGDKWGEAELKLMRVERSSPRLAAKMYERHREAKIRQDLSPAGFPRRLDFHVLPDSEASQEELRNYLALRCAVKDGRTAQ